MEAVRHTVGYSSGVAELLPGALSWLRQELLGSVAHIPGLWSTLGCTMGKEVCMQQVEASKVATAQNRTHTSKQSVVSHSLVA